MLETPFPFFISKKNKQKQKQKTKKKKKNTNKKYKQTNKKQTNEQTKTGEIPMFGTFFSEKITFSLYFAENRRFQVGHHALLRHCDVIR